MRNKRRKSSSDCDISFIDGVQNATKFVDVIAMFVYCISIGLFSDLNLHGDLWLVSSFLHI